MKNWLQMTIMHSETSTAIADIPECMIDGFKVISLYARNVQFSNNQRKTWIDFGGIDNIWQRRLDFQYGVLLVFEETKIQ